MSLYHLRILRLHSVNDFRAEIHRIGADSSLLNDHIAKGTFRAIRLESVLPRLARFLYQEMVLEGGEVVLPARMDDRSPKPVDVLLFGTQYQFQHLAIRLRTQNVDELNILADDLERMLDLYGEDTRAGMDAVVRKPG